MAMARRTVLHDQQTDFSLIDHYIYAIVSDGDLMKACVEAGRSQVILKVGKLIYLYEIIVSRSKVYRSGLFRKRAGRFESYGWLLRLSKLKRSAAIEAAIRDAQSVGDRPSLISV